MRLATARAAGPAGRFAEAEATLSVLVNRLQSEETTRMSHSDLESLLEQQGRELMRQLLQAHLDWRADAKSTKPVVGADGVERTHQRSGTRDLETLLGTVQVTRHGLGARGRETLFPLDAELNLPTERYSFGVRRRAAEEATKGACDEVVKILGTHASAAVAKRQVEEVVRRSAQDFDSFYLERRLAWPTETRPSSNILVLTFDGKGVPMRPADLRTATQEAASRRQRKLTTRLTKGEKRHVKRIAQVAAVYTIAPFVRTADDLIRELRPDKAPSFRPRPRPEGKRVWASLAKEPEEVIDEAFLDAASRDPKRGKSKGRAATSSAIAWKSPGLGGALKAPRPCCGCARCARVATSRTIGSTMSSGSSSAIMRRSTRTERSRRSHSPHCPHVARRTV